MPTRTTRFSILGLFLLGTLAVATTAGAVRRPVPSPATARLAGPTGGDGSAARRPRSLRSTDACQELPVPTAIVAAPAPADPAADCGGGGAR